jgi:hypothetical protein
MKKLFLIAIALATTMTTPVIAVPSSDGACIKNGAPIRRHNQMACEKPGDGARWVGKSEASNAGHSDGAEKSSNIPVGATKVNKTNKAQKESKRDQTDAAKP